MDTATFADLRRKWEAVVAAVAEREAGEAELVAREWVPRLQEMRDRQLELQRDGRWTRGRADFLGVMWMERKEVRHSRMIAWLLDPLGRHGLGVSVLQGLLDRCFADEGFEHLEWGRPECEVVRGPHRADIVIWLPGLTLVIENKVDAPESDGQCDGMCREFAEDPDPHFVFLTPDGRRPEKSTGEGLELFRPLAYGDLRAILRSALATDRRADGRHIAEDYLQTLELEFR